MGSSLGRPIPRRILVIGHRATPGSRRWRPCPCSPVRWHRKSAPCDRPLDGAREFPPAVARPRRPPCLDVCAFGRFQVRRPVDSRPLRLARLRRPVVRGTCLAELRFRFPSSGRPLDRSNHSLVTHACQYARICTHFQKTRARARARQKPCAICMHMHGQYAYRGF